MCPSSAPRTAPLAPLCQCSLHPLCLPWGLAFASSHIRVCVHTNTPEQMHHVTPVSLVLSALRRLNLYLQLQAWVIKSLRCKNYVKLNVSEVGLLPPPLLPRGSCSSLLPGLPASPLLPSEFARSPAVGPLPLRAKSEPPTAWSCGPHVFAGSSPTLPTFTLLRPLCCP